MHAIILHGMHCALHGVYISYIQLQWYMCVHNANCLILPQLMLHNISRPSVGRGWCVRLPSDSICSYRLIIIIATCTVYTKAVTFICSVASGFHVLFKTSHTAITHIIKVLEPQRLTWIPMAIIYIWFVRLHVQFQYYNHVEYWYCSGQIVCMNGTNDN